MKTLKSKKGIFIIISIILIILAIMLFLLLGKNGYRSIKISDIFGTVITENNGENYQAYENMSIGDGYALNTDKDSYTLMLLDDDKYVRLEQESRAVFEDIGSNKNRNTVINLEKGVLTTEIVNPLPGNENYIVNTPNAVLSVRGTYFRTVVRCDENGDYYTDVYTYGGAVACKRILPDGKIVEEEVIIGQGYKACVKMDEIETIYIEELITEEEDNVDPIEVPEICDNDLVGIYNASINGHEMFTDSETLWTEINNRDIDVSRHRSPYDKKPVPEFDRNKHGNGGHNNNKHKDDKPPKTNKKTETTEPVQQSSEALSETTTTTEIFGNQNEISSDNQETTPEQTADIGGATASAVVTTTPFVPSEITTVPVSATGISTFTNSEDTTTIYEETTEINEETSENYSETETLTTSTTATTNETETEESSAETFTSTPEGTTSVSVTTHNTTIPGYVTGPVFPVTTTSSVIVTTSATTTAPTDITTITTIPAVTTEATTTTASETTVTTETTAVPEETTTTTTTTEAHVCEFADYISDNNATCTEDGTKTATCGCGKTDTITDEGSATGHTEKTETTDPTCTETGKTIVSCETCGEAISEEEIPMLGHTEVEETIEATFASEGLYTKSCSVCGETLESEILERLPALYTEDGDITITETGYTQGTATEETAFTGDYVISQKDSSVAVDCAIAINSGTHNVTLDGVNIYSDDNVFSVISNSNVKLRGTEKEIYIETTATSKSAFYCTGTASVTIETGKINLTANIKNSRCFTIYEISSFTLNGGTISMNSECDDNIIGMEIWGCVYLNSGTLSSNIITSSDSSVNTIIQMGGALYCKGSTVDFYIDSRETTTGEYSCIANNTGVLNISSGKMTMKSGGNGIYNGSLGNILNVSGGTVNITADNVAIVLGEGEASFSGGTVNIFGKKYDITARVGTVSPYAIKIIGGNIRMANDVLVDETYGSILYSNGTDELECIVFDAFPSEAERIFTNSDGTSYVYALTEADKADDGKYYVWKPIDLGVGINDTNFPDEVFRNYVSTNFDSNSNGYLSDTEIEAVTEIDVSGVPTADGGITSLQGIEYFEKLEKLDCMCNVGLTQIDVSNNTELIHLDCGLTGITELDVSQNTALVYLGVERTKLTSLDLSNNVVLENLNASSTYFTSIDVSKNTALTYLSVQESRFTSLDLTNNISLQALFVCYTGITYLDVSNNINLKYLNCRDTDITSLDVSNNPSLEILHCYNTKITSLDVSNNTALTDLRCYSTLITSLDVSNNTALTTLQCGSSVLSHINLTNNTNLTSFDASGNKYVIPSNAISYDTSTIEGFDPTKVSNVTNADFNSTTGIFSNITGDVTYTYDCGQGYSETFTLTRTGEEVFNGVLYAEDGKITITETGYKQGSSITETEYTGDYHIYQRDNTIATDCSIAVNSGTHNITLYGVNFESTNSRALYVYSTASATIYSTETNYLSATDRTIYNIGTLIMNGGTYILEDDSGSTICSLDNASQMTLENGVSFESDVYMFNSGVLTVNNGNLYTNNFMNSSGELYFIDGTMNVTGGSEQAYGFWNGNNAITKISGGTVSITGGSRDGYSNTAIYLLEGSLEITGGTVTLNGADYDITVVNGATATVLTGSLVLVNNTVSGTINYV